MSAFQSTLKCLRFATDPDMLEWSERTNDRGNNAADAMIEGRTGGYAKLANLCWVSAAKSRPGG